MEEGTTDEILTTMESAVRIADLFNINDLQHLQDLFADATGVASIITFPDGTPITRSSNFCRLCSEVVRKTEKGLIRCMSSDSVIGSPDPGGPDIHPCLSAGLWDAGTRITVGGRHIANWLIGQVRTQDQATDHFLHYADEIGADPEEFAKALDEVPIMTKEQFEKIAVMLHAFAGELSSTAYQKMLLEQQIRARVKAEEQVSILALALKSISESVCISDLNDNILFVNEAFTRSYGYTSQELIGNQVSMVRSGQNDPEVISQIFPQTMKGGWKGEIMNKRKDGREFPVFISTSIIHNDQGVPVAVMGVASDISERKMVEASLRESEAKFKTLFDGAHDAIFIMDDKCFLDCNRSTGSIFGVTADQIIGRSPSDFSPECQPDGQRSTDKAKRYIDAALAGEPQLFDWVHSRLDGSPFHAEVSLNRIMLKENWYLQAIVRDMTKRKQAEDAMLEKANELERFNKLMIGREIKMIELKKEINELLKQSGLDKKYMIHD